MTDKALTKPLEGDILPADSIKRWAAIRNIMTQTVPPSAIKTRPGRGGKTFSYVSHDWVTNQLNEAFGFDWDWEVLPDTVHFGSDGVTLFGRLTVRTGDRSITKQEPGFKETVPGMRDGDLIKSAASDSLRRCAMRLGLGLSLYGGEDEMTTSEVKTMLASYAKRHLGWDARETFDWLKEQGYSADDLLSKRDAMYEALAQEAGKAGVDEDFDASDDEPADIPLKPRTNLTGVGKDPAELIAKGKAEAPHWIKDPNVRARFWAMCGNLGLDNEAVHAALGVEHVEEYAGTMQEAKELMETAAKAAKSQ